MAPPCWHCRTGEGLRDELLLLSQKFSGRYQSDLYHWRLHLQIVRDEARERLGALRQRERQEQAAAGEQAQPSDDDATDSTSGAEERGTIL